MEPSNGRACSRRVIVRDRRLSLALARDLVLVNPDLVLPSLLVKLAQDSVETSPRHTNRTKTACSAQALYGCLPKQ